MVSRFALFIQYKFEVFFLLSPDIRRAINARGDVEWRGGRACVFAFNVATFHIQSARQITHIQSLSSSFGRL